MVYVKFGQRPNFTAALLQQKKVSDQILYKDCKALLSFFHKEKRQTMLYIMQWSKTTALLQRSCNKKRDLTKFCIKIVYTVYEKFLTFHKL